MQLQGFVVALASVFLYTAHSIMDFLQDLCTVQKADARKKITIIPVDDVIAIDDQLLEGHSLVEWSAKYAELEGVLPIMFTKLDTVCAYCREKGLACIKDIVGDNKLDRVFQHHPCELYAILDVYHPLRVRGLLRHMSILMSTSPIPAIYALGTGMMLFDFYVTQRVPQLPKETIHITKAPEVCSTTVRTKEDAVALEAKLQAREMRVFSPWFSPGTIGVTICNAADYNQSILQQLQACDLTVHIVGEPALNAVSVDADVLVNGGNGPIQSGRPRLAYHLLGAPDQNNNIACELTTVFLNGSPLMKLKTFTAVCVWLHTLYPDSIITHYGSPKLQPVSSNSTIQDREWSRMLELAVWENIGLSDKFSLVETTESPLDQEDKVEQLKARTIENFDDSQCFDFKYIAETYVIHMEHKSWASRACINKRSLRGGRGDNKDMFTCAEFYPRQCMHIVWDNWGDEYYACIEGTNVWTCCTEKEYKSKLTRRVSQAELSA